MSAEILREAAALMRDRATATTGAGPVQTKPHRYTKRPVTIEAIQYDGSMESAGAIDDWILSCTPDGDDSPLRVEVAVNGAGEQFPMLAIATLEGPMSVSVGWFVIRGVEGEFYPCKPEVFEATYDVAAPAEGD